MEFSQGIPSIDLWVKRATADVPNDGRYHVVQHGGIVASFRQKAAALAKYQALRAESGYMPPQKNDPTRDEMLRREDIARDLDRGFDYWNSAFGHRSGGKGRNR
ncbi:MAG: hypothetical protein U0556_08740 [Dehalococcoidia bacterium]